jgi:23S rRNA (uracil1939-C5)-methyltransferase
VRRPPPARRSPAVTGAAAPLRVGQVLRLRCEDLAFGEDGVCRHGAYVVFVPRVLPGELVEVRIERAGRKFARAVPLRVLRPSPDRVEPRCRHFGACGGCTWQHLGYPAQARRKEDLLRRLLGHRVSGEAARAVAPVAAMAEPWGFREKVQLAVKGRAGDPRVGFYRLRSHEVVDVEECPVQPPEAVAQALEVRRALARRKVPIYDERTGRGAVRHVVLRRGRATGDSHLVLVSAREDAPGLAAAIGDLRALRPPLTGASLNLNAWESSVVLGPRTRHLFGRKSWRERIGGVAFEVGPETFFQTNARAAGVLVEEVLRAVPRGPGVRVLDLYAGCGLFALAVAPGVGEVVAVEAGRAAVRDGIRNAEVNRAGNVRYRLGPVERVVGDPRLGRFDAVIADPPREGLGPGVLRGAVLGCRARRLVLVSCDPLTLARDLAEAEALGGRVERVLPVDMFPHTHHLESVATILFGGG